MTLRGWWRERSQAARFDFSVRASFYVNLAVVPLLAAMGAGLGPALWLVLPLLVAHALLCLLLVRAGLESYLGRRPQPARLAVAAVALTAAGATAAYVAYPAPPDGSGGAGAGIPIILAASLILGLSTAVRLRTTVLAGSLACVAFYLLTRAQGDPSATGAIAVAAVLVAMTFAGRTSTWMLGVVWELDRARHVQASLAVTEERLRFARDLHDVVGRTLSVIALKSELAAQLARRGRETAIDEMLEVHRVAQDSLAELRAVVGGYRAADLGAELAGARSLLASAGIECRMIGDGGGLPVEVQSTLGWAVREGTTNVLRHSDARTCTIALRAPASGAVTLTMENDRVRGSAEPGEERVRFGSGLFGLAERLAALGGRLTAERHGPDGFRLSVTLPLAEQPAAPAMAGGAPA